LKQNIINTIPGYGIFCLILPFMVLLIECFGKMIRQLFFIFDTKGVQTLNNSRILSNIKNKNKVSLLSYRAEYDKNTIY